MENNNTNITDSQQEKPGSVVKIGGIIYPIKISARGTFTPPPAGTKNDTRLSDEDEIMRQVNEAIVANGFDQVRCAGQEEGGRADSPPKDDAEDEAARAAYMQQRTGECMDAFKAEIQANAERPRICTGFAELDNDLLDGGLTDGLYILAAIPGLGKSSLVLQIADNISADRHDVLYFSLEMTRAELMAKSISRITWTRAEGRVGLARTARNILYAPFGDWAYSHEQLEALAAAQREYSETIGQHLWILDNDDKPMTADDIYRRVAEHCAITGNRPVVFVDYFQLLPAMMQGYTDKQIADMNILALKMISNKFKVPVVAISSLNRSSYNNPDTLAGLKESGLIEYTANAIITLKYIRPNGERAENREEATLNSESGIEILGIGFRMLKNRFGRDGKLKPGLIFNPAFNHFAIAEPTATKPTADPNGNTILALALDVLLKILAARPEGINKWDFLEGRDADMKAIRSRIMEASGIAASRMKELIDHGIEIGKLEIGKSTDSAAKNKPVMIRAARNSAGQKGEPTQGDLFDEGRDAQPEREEPDHAV